VGWGLTRDQYVHVPFRWTAAAGVEQLGPQPVPGHMEAVAVSRDGSVVVGRESGYGPSYRWTRDTGFVQIPRYYATGAVVGHGISADGNVVVGTANFTWATQGFWWTPQLNVPRSINGATVDPSSVFASTPDGSVLCGSVSTGSGVVAMYWSAATGIVPIGDLPGGSVSAVANAISADGRTIVGQSRAALRYEPFRWTPEEGMVSLGGLPTGGNGGASAVSADGSVVVGSIGGVGFIWTATEGMRPIRDLLLAAGIYDDWDLTAATGISADGRVITGSGLRYLQRPYPYINEGWILTLGSTLCSANCDGSTSPPLLNVNDFQCFLAAYSAGEPYANCDGSTSLPVLNVLDFMCFQQRFAAGCG
jgi:uncharacterized membrane protein